MEEIWTFRLDVTDDCAVKLCFKHITYPTGESALDGSDIDAEMNGGDREFFLDGAHRAMVVSG